MLMTPNSVYPLSEQIRIMVLWNKIDRTPKGRHRVNTPRNISKVSE